MTFKCELCGNTLSDIKFDKISIITIEGRKDICKGCLEKIKKVAKMGIYKPTSLRELDAGDLIEFIDGEIGMVTGGVPENKYYEDKKSIILIRDSARRNWGHLAKGYFQEFKDGEYNRIIKEMDCEIEIKER